MSDQIIQSASKKAKFDEFGKSLNDMRLRANGVKKSRENVLDDIYRFLSNNNLVLIGSTSRHSQTLAGDLVEFLDKAGYPPAQQARQPYTALIKFVFYGNIKDDVINNISDRSAISNLSLVLQASWFYDRRPSEAIRYDGSGTEGRLLKTYKDLKKQKKVKIHAKTPEDNIKAVKANTITAIPFEIPKILTNQMPWEANETFIVMATYGSNGKLSIHAWAHASDHPTVVKALARAL